MYQWGLSLGIGLLTFTRGNSYRHIYSSLFRTREEEPHHPNFFQSNIQTALQSDNFAKQFKKGCKELTPHTYYTVEEYVNFILVSDHSFLGKMLLYDAQTVQFNAHNLNRSTGLLQFTKNDTMSGPVLYSDSVFLGPAGGVLRQGIIYNL